MLLSQTEESVISRFPVEVKTGIVYGHTPDFTGNADVALLLGGQPREIEHRARAAAALYKTGRVTRIMPTGGVEWDTPHGRLSEAAYLSLVLKECGVPEEAIVPENNARTTKENMIFAALELLRHEKEFTVKRIVLVTSAFHMRRSLMLAENYLPRHYEIVSFMARSAFDEPDKWFTDDYHALRVRNEIIEMKRNIVKGIGKDIDY